MSLEGGVQGGGCKWRGQKGGRVEYLEELIEDRGFTYDVEPKCREVFARRQSCHLPDIVTAQNETDQFEAAESDAMPLTAGSI
jgi:hypothetical protein